MFSLGAVYAPVCMHYACQMMFTMGGFFFGTHCLQPVCNILTVGSKHRTISLQFLGSEQAVHPLPLRNMQCLEDEE